ncbi:putative FYVE zinc finger, Zinc finger, FYVE/PHD-type, Zinc finger, RING/FYVE/PHD-type [Plasmopara halstedii]
MARGFSLSRGPAQPVATPTSNEQLNSARVWTPLRENHFEPPLLSSRERAYLVRKSCEASLELVGRTRSTGGPVAWRHIEKNSGVQIYSGTLRTTATDAALTATIMCGVTSVPGTVTEVASLFQLGSTRQMKEFARAHREWFYDGVLLHTLAPRTKEKPLHQVTAKWTVMQMPQGLAHRDFCFLECQDKFIDSKGRKGWVLGQHSIKLPGCDDLKREFGFIRGSMYHSGFVVVESEERAGHVDVIHLVQLNLKDHTPVSANLLRARVMFVAQVRNMLRSKRLNEQRYLSDLELVPRKYRARCAVCQDSFSLLLLRKLNCRKCGEVVCAACSKEFPIENRNFASTNGQDEVRKLRICMHCFQSITNAPKPTSALVEPPHSSTMSMSFLGYRDDEQQASLMTLPANGHQSHQREEQMKIYMQSMRRDKPSRHRMSSTLPIPDFGEDVLPSNSRHRTRGGPDGEWYRGSQQQYQKQQLNSSFSLDYRDNERLRSSNFRPNQSLSLDDPIARGEGPYAMQRPGPAVPTSIFDRPNSEDNRRTHSVMPRSRSTDMLLGASEHNMSNFSRLQVLSSRERLKQLQLEDNMMLNSDHRMPDAYMSALEQASRDKLDFDAPPAMYHAPSSELSAYNASLQDHSVIPTDFGPYDLAVDNQNGPPPLGLSALTSNSPFDYDNSAAMPPTAPRYGDHERDLLRRREREIRLRRQSASSDSSAFSIDIDSYDDSVSFPLAQPIAENFKSQDESGERMMYNTPPFDIPNVATSISKLMKETYVREVDEDSETSMGASDDEEDDGNSAKLNSLLPSSFDDDAQESKGHGLDQTLALPSMFSSAQKPPSNGYERPDLSAASNEIKVPVKHPSPIKAKSNFTAKEKQLQRSNVKDITNNVYHREFQVGKRAEQMSQNAQGRHDGAGEAALRSDAIFFKHEQQISETEDGFDSSFVDRDINYPQPNMRQLDSESSNINRLQTCDGAPEVQEKHGVSAFSAIRKAPPTISNKSKNEVLPSSEHLRLSFREEHHDRTQACENTTSMSDNAADGNQQICVDNSSLRASNEMSLSSVLQSSARGSSICSLGLDSFTPPAIPSSSPFSNHSFSTSPTAVTSQKLAANSRSTNSEGSTLSQSDGTSSPSLPGRFSTLEQLHIEQRMEAGPPTIAGKGTTQTIVS